MPTSNLPLRAGKAWVYEGGIRIPFIIRWPGKIEAGTVNHQPSVSTDLLPTLLDMTGLDLIPEQHVGGENLWPVIKDNAPLDRETLFWHFPHYSGSGAPPAAAVRKGDYKLILWFEDNSVELYNLKKDLGEQNNLVKIHPEIAIELMAELKAWLEDVNANMPQPNPDWHGS